MQFRKTENKSTRLDMTSLMDIVFLLLIFMVVSTTFLDRPGLQLSLPRSKSSAAVKIEKMVVTISRDDRIFVGIEEVDLDILGKKVEEFVKTNTDKTVRIRGDKEVNLGTIIRVMDICRVYGAVGVTIETEKEK
jgi:biopolymer transport protein ExbD